MKNCGIHKQVITVLFILIVFFPTTPAIADNIFQSFVRGVKAQFSGDSEIVDLGNNKYEITYHSSASANSAEKHRNWNSLAKKACQGGSYKVLDTRYRSSTTIDQIMIGTIQCTGSIKSDNGVNTANNDFDKTVVLQAQEHLSTLGYDIVADGIMGKKTQRALLHFQHENGIDATGKPDSKTLKLLQQAIEDSGKIVQSNSDAVVADQSSPQTGGTKVVSQLKELHQLKKDGAITEEEFILLKKKLINN